MKGAVYRMNEESRDIGICFGSIDDIKQYSKLFKLGTTIDYKTRLVDTRQCRDSMNGDSKQYIDDGNG
jgi:hypothetical protein